ncbi:MAG TPA: type II secretion system F family protein, partial [Acidimicrobiia bacterium]|nr:type II secretion system F family protein [Acidimicrobiia bacterium]
MSRAAARGFVASALLGALVLALGGPAGAQESEPLEFVSIDKRDFPRMTVTVAPIGELSGLDLGPKAFEVRQDGEKREANVSRVEGSELEVAIVVDTSGGQAFTGPIPEGLPSALDASKVAARDFLGRMTVKTEVAVIGFNDSPYVAQPLTTDVDAAAAAIDGLQEQGETALYDAVTSTLQQFSPAAQRVVILLSNGADTVSSTTLEDAAERLTASGVALYAVNVQTDESDVASLETLADAASGQVIDAADDNALQGVYDSIAARLANQYQLTFEAEGEGRPAEIQVSLKQGDLAARIDRVVELPRPAGGGASDVPTLVEAPDNDWALPVGLGAIFVAMLIGGLIVFAPRARRRERDRQKRAGVLQGGWHMGQIKEITQRATQFAEHTLEDRGRRRALSDSLEHAGMNVRPGEFLVLAATSAFVALVMGFLLGGLIMAVIFSGLVLVGFRFSVSILADRRRNKFAAQLGDTLQLLSGSLRAGYGMLQALDAVAREAEAPTSQEFGRVVIETRLGRNPSESLHALAKRMGNEDFEWVVQAIDIHREVGGDLTEVLDTVAATIRQRDQLRRQVKALSAEGRLSAGILFGLPLAMFVAIRFINPDYMSEMTGSAMGRIMMAFAAFLLFMGGMWLRKIVKLEF